MDFVLANNIGILRYGHLLVNILHCLGITLARSFQPDLFCSYFVSLVLIAALSKYLHGDFPTSICSATPTTTWLCFAFSLFQIILIHPLYVQPITTKLLKWQHSRCIAEET